jgi:hypothetical protein
MTTLRAVATQSTTTCPLITTSVVSVGTDPPQVAGSHHDRAVPAESAPQAPGTTVLPAAPPDPPIGVEPPSPPPPEPVVAA